MSTKRTTCVLVCTHTTEQLLDKFCACFVNVLKKYSFLVIFTRKYRVAEEYCIFI